MKKLLLFATSYPYTTGIIAILWLGSVILLRLDENLSASVVVTANALITVLIASVGFRR